MIYLSPLQGLTDHIFRNALFTTIGGIDKYFAPYYSLVQKSQIQRKQLRDIEPQRQVDGIPLIPQIMGADVQAIVDLCIQFKELGYSEVNWNLGCPYPMVANRGCGVGAIANVDNVKAVLDAVCAIEGLDFSIKMRLGNESSDDFMNIKPLLAQYQLKELIVHPRTGKQLYKGEADREFFETHISDLPFPVVYNGDITEVQDGVALHQQFGTIAIGRGAIANPLLPAMIIGTQPLNGETYQQAFWSLHAQILQGTIQRMDGGDAQVTRKMYEYWQYWQVLFPEAHKEVKKLKKCTKISVYTEVTTYIERNMLLEF